MIAVWIVIGIVAGVIATFLLMHGKLLKLRNEKLIADKEVSNLKNENENLQETSRKQLKDIENLQGENKSLVIENTGMKTRVEMNEANEEKLKESFSRERAELEARRKESEENAERLRIENERQWQIKFEKLKEEFQNIALKTFAEKQETLEANNKEQIAEILKPIRDQFDAFKKSVDDSKTSNEVAKKELQNSFESTLKLFVQQQNQAVEALKQETIKIGNDANNLTNALKRDTKKQGNWGELILETILESSGLEKGIHYTVQETVKDDDGKFKRPDVIVKFPEGKSVIIDSKVSLTAYADAYETEDEDLRRRRLKDHARSVRKHIDELADKSYDALVKDAIGFILMFIPNDQCYLTAIEEDPDLSRYAYAKGIVIISPSNLMMALQLAYNMWKEDIRNRNIDEIVKSANELYDKVANFSETMEGVEKSLNSLNTNFQKAKNQLYEGNGNVMKKVEGLKKFGITPKKQIKNLGVT